MKAMKKMFAFLLCILLVGAMAVPAFADDSNVISEVRLTVTPPKAGETPDMTIVSAQPDKYTATVRYWLKQYSSSSEFETFEGGHTYGVVVNVTPVGVYRFETAQKNKSDFDESPTLVYLNGELTHCVSTETDVKLSRALNFELPEEDTEQTDTSFFGRILQAIRDFFAKIRDFFENLFYPVQPIR